MKNHLLALPFLLLLAPAVPAADAGMHDAVLDLDEDMRESWPDVLAKLSVDGAKVYWPNISDAAKLEELYQGAIAHFGADMVEDPRGFYYVTWPEGTDVAAQMQALQLLPEVEKVTPFAIQALPAGDNPPNPAPNLAPAQSYFWQGPTTFLPTGAFTPPSALPMGGHNLLATRPFQSAPLPGSNVSVAVLEFAYTAPPWNPIVHENLTNANITVAFPNPGDDYVTPLLNPILSGSMDHGTADLSIIVGDNEVGSNPLLGNGVSGAVPGAQAFFVPTLSAQSGLHIAQAITLATTLLGPGDVMLIELQLTTPTGLLVPVTFNPANQTAIAVAEAAGINVVYAAGNGANDLDAMGLAPTVGTMIGAVNVFTGARESFSNYSNSIPFCAQGSMVTAAGYGDLIYAPPAGVGNDETYTAIFNGTSSASAITTGMFASLVDAWRSSLVTGAAVLPLPGAPAGWPIDPASMRTAATQYAPSGGAGNQRIGQYVDALRTLRRLGVVPNGTGSTSACAGPGCVLPSLSNHWTCSGSEQWSEPQIGNLAFNLRVSGVPTYPGTFSTLFWSLLPANVVYPGLPGPAYVDLPSLVLTSPPVLPTVGCDGCGSSPSICGEAFIPTPIPNIPSLAGFPVWGQALTIGPSGYISFTNGVKATLLP